MSEVIREMQEHLMAFWSLCQKTATAQFFVKGAAFTRTGVPLLLITSEPLAVVEIEKEPA